MRSESIQFLSFKPQKDIIYDNFLFGQPFSPVAVILNPYLTEATIQTLLLKSGF